MFAFVKLCFSFLICCFGDTHGLRYKNSNSLGYIFVVNCLFFQITPTGYARSSHSEVSLGKDVLKIWSKFTGEHPCRSVISIKLLCNFIEITLRQGCSPVNLLHTSRTPFCKNTYGGLLLYFKSS